MVVLLWRCAVEMQTLFFKLLNVDYDSKDSPGIWLTVPFFLFWPCDWFLRQTVQHSSNAYVSDTCSHHLVPYTMYRHCQWQYIPVTLCLCTYTCCILGTLLPCPTQNGQMGHPPPTHTQCSPIIVYANDLAGIKAPTFDWETPDLPQHFEEFCRYCELMLATPTYSNG